MTVFDHRGKEYCSIYEMCEDWGIKKPLYYKRRKNGMSLQEALETPVKVKANKSTCGVVNKRMGIPCEDHLGCKYISMTSMCMTYGISLSTYTNRRKRGLSVEEALTKEVTSGKSCEDHSGIKYKSIQEMIDFYGIRRDVYWSRVRQHWDLERILTTPCKKH